MEAGKTAAVTPFSEKGFYLREFRGRTLAIAAPPEDLGPRSPLHRVLEELELNQTRVVLISTRSRELEAALGAPAIPSDSERLEGAVWRALGEAPRAGVVAAKADALAAVSREVALRLGLSKLVWLDGEGGLRGPDGGRHSFVDREELRGLLGGGLAGESSRRLDLLRELEAALDDGLPALNLCTPEGLAEELFTYGGSGTLFTRERYIEVRKLGIDDYAAAADLMARGVSEGYLAPRSAAEVEVVLANGFGAFVEGRHLAGIGALLVYPSAPMGEIASLYTLTRFLGEGVGGHLVGFALRRAREMGCASVVACTTSDRVVAFFQRHGFRPVPSEELPPEKWRDYDPARSVAVHCLRRDEV